MVKTRRAFIADGCLGAAAVVLHPLELLGCGALAFEPAIGVCRSVDEAQSARAAGAEQLEGQEVVKVVVVPERLVNFVVRGG